MPNYLCPGHGEEPSVRRDEVQDVSDGEFRPGTIQEVWDGAVLGPRLQWRHLGGNRCRRCLAATSRRGGNCAQDCDCENADNDHGYKHFVHVLFHPSGDLCHLYQ